MSYLKFIRTVKPSLLDPTQKPADEKARLEALRRYEIFNTPPEEIFRAYTELAALTLKTPIALMSFVESDKVHYKHAYGIDREGEVIDRQKSPCSIAIMSKEVSQFRYALADPCVLADEKNLAEAGYKFYAGAPMTTTDGFNIGILAVVDRNSRSYTAKELKTLKALAKEVMQEVELRLDKNDTLPHKEQRLREILAKIQLLSH